MMQPREAAAKSPHEDVAVHTQHFEVAQDLDDPHAAALADPKSERISTRTIAVVFCLALTLAAPLIYVVLLSTVLIQIGTALGSTVNVSWFINAWSITNSVAAAISGNLSDVFGRRYVVMAGQVVLLVGFITVITADTDRHLIAGSAIVGCGSGTSFVGYASISEIVPNKWRGAGVGLMELLVFLPWGACGALISVNLIQNTAFSWRWLIIICIIYVSISLIGTPFLYFPPPRPTYDYNKTRWQEFKEIDFIGCSLYAAGLTVLLIGFSWAGTSKPWDSAGVIAPLVIGVSLLVLCVVYDFKIAKHPFLHPAILKMIREYTLLLVSSCLFGAIYYSMSAILPLTALYVFTSDAIEIGIIQLPQGIGQIAIGVVASALIGRVKHVRVQYAFWIAVIVVFTAVLAPTVPNSKAAFSALQFFSMGACPVATGLGYVIASLNVPLRHLGFAIGLIGTLRNAGGAVGQSVLLTVLNNYVDDNLSRAILGAAALNGFTITTESAGALIGATIQNAVGVPGAFAAVPGITPAVQQAAAAALKVVYAEAFRRVCYVSLAFGIPAIVAACFISDPSKYLTNHTAVHLGHNNDNDSDDAAPTDKIQVRE